MPTKTHKLLCREEFERELALGDTIKFEMPFAGIPRGECLDPEQLFADIGTKRTRCRIKVTIEEVTVEYSDDERAEADKCDICGKLSAEPCECRDWCQYCHEERGHKGDCLLPTPLV